MVPTPERYVNAKWVSADKCYAIVLIVTPNGAGDYLFDKYDEWTYSVTKLESSKRTIYSVWIGYSPECSCDGFRNRGECKHVSALLILKQRGKL